MEFSLTVLVLVSSQFSIWAAVGSLPVLVHDYAGVAPNVLARAEVEASRVLATAAVDVQWINCTDSSTDPEPCRRLPDATALVVQILPDAPLFSRAHIQKRSLQVLSLSDIDACCNDALRLPIAFGK